MSALEFKQFSDLCNRQEVHLTPRILSAAQNGESFYDLCTDEPTAMLAAIVQAGIEIRLNSALAEKPIMPTKYILKDSAAKTLLNIINTSITPITEPTTIAAFNCPDANEINVCSEAEGHFMKTLESLKTLSLGDKYVEIGSQVITANDKPLFLRKSSGEPSALALRRFILNGVLYPAGSLVSVELESDQDSENPNKFNPDIPNWAVDVIPATEIAGLSFLRLSMFAIPPAERPRLLPSDRERKLGKYTMEDLRVRHIRKIACIALDPPVQAMTEEHLVDNSLLLPVKPMLRASNNKSPQPEQHAQASQIPRMRARAVKEAY